MINKKDRRFSLDKRKDSPRMERRESLMVLPATRGASVQPELLRQHAWILTPILFQPDHGDMFGQEEEKSAAMKEEYKAETSVNLPMVDRGRTSGRGSEETASLKRRRSRSPSNSRSVDTPDPKHQQDFKKPRRTDNRRKPICVNCWETSSWCDFDGQCGSCKIYGIKCVRKLCSEGERCFNQRCPCLHPGEWDETNSDWVVETGTLPRRRPASPKPVEYGPGRRVRDNYRSGDEE